MTRQPHPEEPNGLDLPDPLRQALADFAPPSVRVPAAVDEAILHAARAHLSTATRRAEATAPGSRRRSTGILAEFAGGLRWAFRPALAWGVGIACLAVVSWLALARYGFRSQVEAGDLNRDGCVDILDALALARRLEQNLPLDGRWDLNGDGVIDRRDADAIAIRCVRLVGSSDDRRITPWDHERARSSPAKRDKSAQIRADSSRSAGLLRRFIKREERS